MKIKQHNKRASAALTTVIALTGILLFGGIIVLFNAMDLAKATKNSLYASMTGLRATTCFEESLQRLKYDPTYTGTLTVTYDDGSCDSIISDHPTIPTHKTIEISAIIGDYTYVENKIVNAYSSPFEIID